MQVHTGFKRKLTRLMMTLVCVEDDNANLITEVVHDSSRVKTFSNASIIERSGGMFNLRQPRPYALVGAIKHFFPRLILRILAPATPEER